MTNRSLNTPSDTPRTDEAELPIKTAALCCGHVPAEFARELEREIARLKAYLPNPDKRYRGNRSVK